MSFDNIKSYKSPEMKSSRRPQLTNGNTYNKLTWENIEWKFYEFSV